MFNKVDPASVTEHDLETRDLPPGVAEAMNLKPVDLAEMKDLGIGIGGFDGCISGTLIPFRGFSGEGVDTGRVKLHGAPGGEPVRGRKDGKITKYSGPRGVHQPPYFPKHTHNTIAARRDLSKSLIITEGEFKSAVIQWALEELGRDDEFIVMGLPGVDSFGPDVHITGNQGLHHEIAQFDMAEWVPFKGLLAGSRHRKVYILYDWDPPKVHDHGQGPDQDQDEDLRGRVSDNGDLLASLSDPSPGVALAERALAACLHVVGADVYACRLFDVYEALGAVDSDVVQGTEAMLSLPKLAIDDMVCDSGHNAAILAKALRLANKAPGCKHLLQSKWSANEGGFSVASRAMACRVKNYEGDRVLDMMTGAVYKSRQAAAASEFGAFVYEFQKANGEMASIPAVKHDAVMFGRGLRKNACHGFDVDPGPYYGVRMTREGELNLWRGWTRGPTLGMTEPWNAFLDYFFADDPEFRDVFEDWVAHMVQYPWRRHLTSLIISSHIEGTGKSFICETIARMMGVRAGDPACVVGPDVLFSQFNDTLAGKVLVVCNEPSSDKDDHTAKWKDARTADEIVIDKKYGAKYTLKNTMNYMVTTNMAYVTRTGVASRRDWVYCPDLLSPSQGIPLIKRVVRWLDHQHGYELLLGHYLSRDVSHFDPNAPAGVTTGKERMAEMSEMDTDQLVRECVEAIEHELDTKDLKYVLVPSAIFFDYIKLKFNEHESTYRRSWVMGALRRLGVRRGNGRKRYTWDDKAMPMTYYYVLGPRRGDRNLYESCTSIPKKYGLDVGRAILVKLSTSPAY